MDFIKFVSLLDSQALYFSRSDQLGDPFEGSVTRRNLDLREGDSKLSQNIRICLSKAHKAATRSVYINCWHMGEHESDAMWVKYATKGIAIQSTFRRLSLSFTTNKSIFIGTVNYIDHLIDDPIPENNLYYPFLYKRKSFQHENELRAILGETDYLSQNLSPDIQERQKAPIGVSIKVDPAKLIKKIFMAPFSPDWQIKLVQSVIRTYGYKFEITKSKMDEEPIY